MFLHVIVLNCVFICPMVSALNDNMLVCLQVEGSCYSPEETKASDAGLSCSTLLCGYE